MHSFGAIGDGKTDDRAAITEALLKANGAPVDGEGKVYAVRGNIDVRNVPVNFRNATLVQTMEKMDVSKYIPSAKGNGKISVEPADAFIKDLNGLPVLHASGIGTYPEDPVLSGEDLAKVTAFTGIRTLAVRGSKDKTVPVRLEKIRILRGQDAGAGSRNESAGLTVEYCSPLDLIDVEVTGDGKGTGIKVSDCTKVNMLRLNIHDIRWAPYTGDVTIPLKSVRDDFGWNNFPIYEYRSALKKFVRVRVQEQLAGLFVQGCEDVVIADSTIAHLETLIEGKPYAIQADGMTLNMVKNLLVKNCNISFAWEGIDFTGASGQDFVFENVRTKDCFSFGIKLAHPKQNGKMINCVAERSGNVGFEIEAGVENVEYTNCRALDTGSSGNWKTSDGFRIIARGKPGEAPPKQIHLVNCSAINKLFPGTIAYGFYCPPEASGPEFQNTASNCVVEGAKKEKFAGFEIK